MFQVILNRRLKKNIDGFESKPFGWGGWWILPISKNDMWMVFWHGGFKRSEEHPSMSAMLKHLKKRYVKKTPACHHHPGHCIPAWLPRSNISIEFISVFKLKQIAQELGVWRKRRRRRRRRCRRRACGCGCGCGWDCGCMVRPLARYIRLCAKSMRILCKSSWRAEDDGLAMADVVIRERTSIFQLFAFEAKTLQRTRKIPARHSSNFRLDGFNCIRGFDIQSGTTSQWHGLDEDLHATTWRALTCLSGPDGKSFYLTVELLWN